MPYYPYIPSGTFILEVNPSGATPLISGGYTAATGATGVGGIYEASGFKVVDNFFFAHTTGNSADQDYLATGNPTNIALATGTGYVYGGDIRGTGDNYLALGTTTPTGLASEVEHFVGAYARYTDAAGKTLTGLISGGNGYYTGSYTTLPPLQQFVTVLPNLDTGNLGNSSTGSGVHLFRDVTLTFSEIVDRAGVTLETQDQLQNNIFFDGFDIDILDITGGMVFTGYRSGLKSRSFSFSEQENINVFGSYTSDFGVRYSLQDQNGEEQVNEIYLYGNPLEIDFLYITDASGRHLSQSNASNFITTGSSADELFLTNRQAATGEPITGGINIEFAFKNDPNYTEYGNSIHVYGQTGSGEFPRNSSNFIATIPLTKDQAGQTFQLTPKDGDAEGLITETDYYFQLVPESAISKGQVFTVGPHKIQPVEQDPRNAGQPLYNRGNQYLVGDLDVSGCVTGRCLTISTPSNPNTIETAGGNVGIGTVPGTAVGDPKLDINGNLEGIGTAGRVTGPGGVDYALSTDIPADDDTLQSVTDRGNTTSTPVTLGISMPPTSPLTIITNGDTDSGIDLYADGSYGDQIITLGTDANDAGRLVVKDADGDDSVTISNDSSRGSITCHDDGGNVRTSLIVDSNGQGKMTMLDSSANDSIVLSSDSNKRGSITVHDSAGATKVSILADASNQGKMTLLDSSANESVVLSSESYRGGRLDIYDAGGNSVVEMKAETTNEGILSIKNQEGILATKIQGHKSILSATNSNIFSTGSVIIGGSGHIISGDYDAIAGGADNQISGIGGDFNFIGGGSGVDISESKFASSIGGENNDIISGDYSVIAGGQNNLISGNQVLQDRFNFIGGGQDNKITGVGDAAIMGGAGNRIEGANSFIGCGNSNTAFGEYSFIGGGQENFTRRDFASIVAGENNEADGGWSVVAGGNDNFASGNYSFVGGGQSNKVSGDYSYAFGRKALIAATHSGAAVLADGQNRVHASSGEHTLNLDFASGVYIGGGGALYVSGNPVMTGAHTVEADTFQTVTDRGATTTNSIEVAGKYLSGVTGVFSKSLEAASGTFGRGFLTSDAPVDGLAVEGAVGIGTNIVSSPLGVNGGATLGGSYVGAAAPSDGLLVEGNVGIGTSSPKAALDVARDTDASGIIGRAQIGYVGDSDFASFAHVDFANATDYAFAQTSAGHTVINARDGYNIYVREGDANIAVFDGSTKDFYVDTDTLYVDASADKVGINTSAPTHELDVRGTISGYSGFFSGMVQIGKTGHYNHVPTELLSVQPGDDVSAEIGQAHVGYVGHSNYAGFSHIDMNTTTNYAFLQQANGATYVNSKAGTNIYFMQGGSNKGGFNTSSDFYIDTDTLYVDASEDSVGINTSAPTQELDVRGTSLLSGQVIIDGGVGVSSSATLHLRQKGNADTDGIALTSSNATSHRIWKDSAGTLNIGPSTNTDAFVQDLNGNVGIGTNSPVSGVAHIYKNATIGTITAPNAGNAGLHIEDSSANMYLDGNSIVTDNNSYISTSGSNYLAFGTNNTERIRIEGGGDVGIGTTNPAYCLEVSASKASSLLSRFYNTSTTNGQGLLIRAGETANANRILQLASRNDTKVMTVNSNGSVGVGTTTPKGRFDIVSSRNIENDLSDADNCHLHLHNNSDDTDESIGIGFGITSDTDALGACIGHERKGPSSFGDLFFATKPDGGSVTERVRIASDGNVGIGTDTPANALDVVGHFSATSKSFVIDHPTKENKKLQYGSLEGPEHGVFVRGTSSKNVIKLPDYWKDLVHEDSITVTLTPLHTFQSLYVKSKTPEQIMVGGVEKSYDYVVYGERKDIDKLAVEI